MSSPDAAVDFETAFDMVPTPALVLSCELTILACNRAYEQVAHLSRERMLGRALFEVFPGSDPRQAERLKTSLELVLKHKTPHSISVIQYGAPGPGEPDLQERFWTISNLPLLGKDNTLLGILHCPADITELTQLRQDNTSPQGLELDAGTEADLQRWMREAQTLLQTEHGRLQQLFQQAPGFICVLQGPHHVFELANDAYYQLVGHREIIGHPLAEVLPEVTPQGFLKKLDGVYATGVPFIGRAMPIALQRDAGGRLEQRFIDLIYQPIRDGEGRITGIFVQGNDVTEAHVLAQEVAYQAAHDTLTGLCNRREFARQTQDTTGPGPHGLLYMDIDHFKIINDRCGHAAGDELLLQVADALKAQCDDGDLLARLGGDEFALMRGNCSPEAAVDLAERLREAVRQIAFIWQGKRYGITVSIGVASFGPTEGLSFERALGLADAACFLAKEKGRNRVQMSLATDAEVRQQRRHMDHVTRLKEALREDRVVLYAQRIVGLQPDAREPQVFCEVLARLRDLDGTLVAPGGFIPAAERFGLIEEFDRHIVGKLFAHLQAQPDPQRDTTCYFINLSGMTLSAPGFSDFVEASLAACPAVRASRICFEVTETAALSNIRRTAKVMDRLIEKGFRFALDDFGSGMASFVYLQRLPVQFVKIDGEFVKAILDQPANAIIVEAVTRVAHSMTMRTIAEAVETDALLPHLRALGLDYAQGYGLHLPEPIESLLAKA